VTVHAYAATEEKNDINNDSFYDHRAMAHNTKIIMADPNAKMSQEETF
jgi:hypothetical protein